MRASCAASPYEYQTLLSHNEYLIFKFGVLTRRAYFNLICWILQLKHSSRYSPAAHHPVRSCNCTVVSFSFCHVVFTLYFCVECVFFASLVWSFRRTAFTGMESSGWNAMTRCVNKYIQFWFHKSYFMQSLITPEQFPTSLPFGFVLILFGFFQLHRRLSWE